MIVFEEDGHRYWYEPGDGTRRELVSVSRALKDAGLVDARYFRPHHAQRGKMIHRACMLAAQEVLDPETVDPTIAGHVRAWQGFLLDLMATVLRLEYIVGDLELGGGYGGRVDCKLAVGGPYPVLVDIKSGSPASWHEVQIGAYLRGDPDGWEHLSGAVVYLKASGRYRLQQLDYGQKVAAVRQFEAIMMARQGEPLFAEAEA